MDECATLEETPSMSIEYENCEILKKELEPQDEDDEVLNSRIKAAGKDSTSSLIEKNTVFDLEPEKNIQMDDLTPLKLELLDNEDSQTIFSSNAQLYNKSMDASLVIKDDNIAQELVALRARVKNFETEKGEYEKLMQEKSDNSIVEIKTAHQRSLLNLEADIETTMRAQITSEIRDMHMSPTHGAKRIKNLQEELSRTTNALKVCSLKADALGEKLKEAATKHVELKMQVKVLSEKNIALEGERSALTMSLEKYHDLDRQVASQILKLDDEKMASLRTRTELENRLARQSAQYEEQQREQSAQRSADLGDLRERLRVAMADLKNSKSLFANRTAQYDLSILRIGELERALKSAAIVSENERVQNELRILEIKKLLNSEEMRANIAEEKLAECDQELLKTKKELHNYESASIMDREARDQTAARLIETLGDLSKIKGRVEELETLSVKLMDAETENCKLRKTSEDLQAKIKQDMQKQFSLQNEVRRLVRQSSQGSLNSSGGNSRAESRMLSTSNLRPSVSESAVNCEVIQKIQNDTQKLKIDTSFSDDFMRQQLAKTSNPALNIVTNASPDSAVKLDYLRQTVRQFLLRPGSRRQLIPLIQVVIGFSTEESKQLDRLFN